MLLFMFSTLYSFLNQQSLIIVLKSIFLLLNVHSGELLQNIKQPEGGECLKNRYQLFITN